MTIKFKILQTNLIEEFKSKIDFDPIANLKKKKEEETPFEYFKFYRSVSSVYSSKIEGEQVEIDSYMKHQFLNVKYESDYTKRADDLFAAYEFMETNKLKEENVVAAHELLSKNLLAKSLRGKIRNNPMFVMNEEDRIEYVVCEPSQVKKEWDKLFTDIKLLQEKELTVIESFYYAAQIHLIFLKIHPMQDGNGRTARLIEKWFLKDQIGEKIIASALEKNYYLKKQTYYNKIRKIGSEYEQLDYSKSLDFLLMTVNSLKE